MLGFWVKLNKGLGRIKRKTVKLLTMLMLVTLVMVVIKRHLLVMVVSSQNLSESQYIGLGLLAGRENNSNGIGGRISKTFTPRF